MAEAYLDELIKAKKVQLRLDDQDGIQEVQSMEQIHGAGNPNAMRSLCDGFVKSNELKAKVERLTQAMIFFSLFVVALVAMGVGYLLKENITIRCCFHIPSIGFRA